MRGASAILNKDDINIIMLQVENIEDAEIITGVIEETIDNKYRSEDFTKTTTMLVIIRSIQNVFDIIQILIISIGAISLIVASRGIMNTMLVSVMERTHEMGIMKAIGATNADIMSLFIIEAGIISLIGGILGILFGIIGAYAISSWTSTSLMIEVPAMVSVNVMLFGIVLAIFVGIGSGLYPARQASKMSPVEDLQTTQLICQAKDHYH